MEKEIQTEHHDFQSVNHDFDIIVVADHFSSPANMGMLVRTAEAMGVQAVYFISDTYNEMNSKMKRTSRAAENNIDIFFDNNWLKMLDQLRSEGYEITAIEMTNQSVKIQDYKTDKTKIVLLAGNERSGLSAELLNLSHSTVHIPMYGSNSSMNVVTATAIVLYSIIHS